ncbi:MAG: hypothetical protein NTU53_21850 [Planctomycetota bacterium]|nr:hypothetical protein [Planctomycetota bacterium]
MTVAAESKSSRKARAGAAKLSVRMYRQGLGDCFLLTFSSKKGPRYLLIDCGVITGTDKGKEVMTAVVKDICTTTRGHLHAVAATHEHWDHVSGFVQAREAFDDIKQIDEVWLPWTEDPIDPLAQKLVEGRRKAVNSLRQAAMKLRAAESAMAEPLERLLGFSGPLAAGKGQTTAEALEYLRKRVAEPKYCRPGDQLTLPDVEGVRIYVLGPPVNETLIRKSDPTKKGREVYEMAFAFGMDSAFLTAVDQLDKRVEDLSVDEAQKRVLTQPFDRALQIPKDEAADQPFFMEHYGRPGDTAMKWRQIEGDWLDSAGALALKLDSDTNNTSLVIAVELVESGQVLLFTGDAQVGNWESWSGGSWEIDGRTVKGADLLARTVLYKVGHHGSHNATLRAGGLELMASKDLTAMIPVDRAIAMAKVPPWNMPFPSLLKRLEQKTSGRILRLDRKLEDLKANGKPEGVSAALWSRFRPRLRGDEKDELYVECDFPG